MLFCESMVYHAMDLIHDSGKTPDTFAVLEMFLNSKEVFENVYGLEKFNTEQRYNLVKTLFLINRNSLQVSTPVKLYDMLIPENLLYENNILLPDVKTGGVLLELLYRCVQKNPLEINEIFNRIYAHCSNEYNRNIIKAAVEFIFKQKIRIKKENFVFSNVKDKFSCVICNPPFGKIQLENLSDFELSFGKKNVESAVLFLEKIYNLTEDNACISIFLPDGLLTNPMHQKTRSWILEKFNIEKIISLPSSAFKPAAAIKTCVLFLVKGLKTNNNIKLAVLEDGLGADKLQFFEVSKEEFSINNFTPEYYQRKNSDIFDFFETSSSYKLSEIATVKKDKASILKDLSKSIKYIDISSVDAKTGLIGSCKEVPVSKAPKRAYYEVNYHDLIIAVSGGAIGTKAHSMAVIDENHDGYICSNGFRVLTLKENINPYYLWYFMRSNYFLRQVELLASGSTILNLKENDFLSLKVIIPPVELQEIIANRVLENIKKYKETEAFLCENESELTQILKGGM